MCSIRCSVAPMTQITSVAKGRKIAPGRTLSSLSLPQVRMILRIYWTDLYQRRALGFKQPTRGIRERLARQFDVSIEVIKKVVTIRHNQHGRPRRQRFKTISLKTIQRRVKSHLHQRGIPVEKHPAGRPRKTARTFV